MSEISKNINRQVVHQDGAIASMLSAFDLPLESAMLKIIDFAVSGNTDGGARFRLSLSREGKNLILGFENIESGNRITVTYEGDNVQWPEWMLEGDNHFVTCDAVNLIDRSRERYNTNPFGIVAVTSLNGLWLVCDRDWALRQTHTSDNKNDLSQQININAGRFVGGVAIFNSNGRITTDPVAKITFKSAAMAKSVLRKAGSSKPQGDLIVYFSKDSCAAEGYNSVGKTTLEFGSIGSKRQIKSYESEIEEGILAVKYHYPEFFKAVFSTKHGILNADNIKESTISYGTTEHGKPYLCVSMPGCKVELVLQSEQPVFVKDGLTMPVLALGDNIPRVAKQVEPEKTDLPFEELDIQYPEAYSSHVKIWYDDYVEQVASKGGEITIDISKWFTSYLMKCAKDGTPISVEMRDAYREVTKTAGI